MADQGKKPSKGETPGKIPAAVRSCREIWGEGHGPAFMLPLPCRAHPGDTVTPGLFKVSLWLQHREAPVARSVLRREFQKPGEGLLKRPGDSRALWVVGRVVWYSTSCRGARRVSLESSVGIFSGRQWRRCERMCVFHRSQHRLPSSLSSAVSRLLESRDSPVHSPVE